MSKYLDRLNENKDEKEKKQNQLEEAKAIAVLKSEIAKFDAQSALLAAAREQALGTTPFNLKEVIRIDREIEDNLIAKETAEDILSEEFATSAD